MARWIVGILVGSLAICVVCAVLGVVVVAPKIRSVAADGQTEIARTMADNLAFSVARVIAETPPPVERLTIAEADFDVNNAVLAGQSGVRWTSEGASIYGIVARITPAGISLLLQDGLAYSAVPVVENGRVELTAITVSNDGLAFLFPARRFEEAIEGGINRALAARGLTPSSIEMDNGSLTIVMVAERAGTPVADGVSLDNPW